MLYVQQMMDDSGQEKHQEHSRKSLGCRHKKNIQMQYKHELYVPTTKDNWRCRADIFGCVLTDHIVISRSQKCKGYLWFKHPCIVIYSYFIYTNNKNYLKSAILLIALCRYRWEAFKFWGIKTPCPRLPTTQSTCNGSYFNNFFFIWELQ